MHGGAVNVESAGPGRGSTFSVRLPLAGVQAQPLKAVFGRPRRDTLDRAAFSDLVGVRVLAIDDEADALTLVRVILESAGAEVTVLGTAVGAIAEISRVQPHALVVNLGMPELDGFEFIKRVRLSPDPAVRDVPAAALTAFARSEDRTKALRSGFELHLAKPIDPQELAAAIATLVRRGHLQGQRAEGKGQRAKVKGTGKREQDTLTARCPLFPRAYSLYLCPLPSALCPVP